MSAFTEILQAYVNMNYEDLVESARYSIANLLPVCAEFDKKSGGRIIIIGIILSAVAADGELSATERKMLREILAIGDDEVDALIAEYDAETAAMVDRFADSMSAEVKANVLGTVMSIAAADECITRAETAFIKRLIE